MGIEPTPTAWKAVVLAVILHPQVTDIVSYSIVTYRAPVVKKFLLYLRHFPGISLRIAAFLLPQPLEKRLNSGKVSAALDKRVFPCYNTYQQGRY